MCGDLGKGYETIDLVPFLASTPPDAGVEQEGDFQLATSTHSPLSHSLAIPGREGQLWLLEDEVTRPGAETELGVFKQNERERPSVERPRTAGEAVGRGSCKMLRRPSCWLVGPTMGSEENCRPLPLKCLGVNITCTKKVSLNGYILRKPLPNYYAPQ